MNEREEKRHKVHSKEERESLVIPTHGPAHGTSSVFVCVLSEALCVSQAGWGAADTGSLMRHRGRARESMGEEEKRQRPRENHREKLDCGKRCIFFSFT